MMEEFCISEGVRMCVYSRSDHVICTRKLNKQGHFLVSFTSSISMPTVCFSYSSREQKCSAYQSKIHFV